MYLNIKSVLNFKDIDYHNFAEPTLITNGCVDMKAIKYWSPDYLSKVFRNTPVSIEIYKSKELMGQTSVNNYQEKPFNEVISHILQDKAPYYYFAEIPLSNYEQEIGSFLKSDIQSSFDNHRKSLEDLIFMGYNSFSGCHLHINDDYILNQIVGTKTVYLYEYMDNPHLRMNSFTRKNKNFIKANLFRVPHNNLKIYKVTLKPGNSLIIPPWWFHAVQGHGFSCSVTKVYERSNIDYLKKYKYLYFLFYLDDLRKWIINLSLGILFLLLIIFITLYFIKKKR